LKTNLPVPLRTRAHGIGRHVHKITVLQRAQSALHHTDVRLQATKEECAAPSRNGLQSCAELVVTKAAELYLINRVPVGREQGGNLRNGRSKAFGILRCYQDRQLQNICQPEKKLGIAHKLFTSVDGWEQLLLNINHQQSAVFSPQRQPRDI